jgi:hypothetical protein
MKTSMEHETSAYSHTGIFPNLNRSYKKRFIVQAPDFVADIVVDLRNNKIMKADPQLRFMVGWAATRADDYCNTKGWYLLNA